MHQIHDEANISFLSQHIRTSHSHARQQQQQQQQHNRRQGEQTNGLNGSHEAYGTGSNKLHHNRQQQQPPPPHSHESAAISANIRQQVLSSPSGRSTGPRRRGVSFSAAASAGAGAGAVAPSSDRPKAMQVQNMAVESGGGAEMAVWTARRDTQSFAVVLRFYQNLTKYMIVIKFKYLHSCSTMLHSSFVPHRAPGRVWRTIWQAQA